MLELDQERSAALDVETERDLFLRRPDSSDTEGDQQHRQQGGEEPFPQPVIGGEIPAEKDQQHQPDKKCECGTHSRCRLSILAVTLSLRCLRDTRDGRFFHLDFHVIGNFHDHRGIFHIGNESVNAGIGYDAIAGFQRTD